MGFATSGGYLRDSGEFPDVLTAQADDGGNYHSRGFINTGPAIMMIIVGPVWIAPRE